MVDKANADDRPWQGSVNTAGTRTRPEPILKEEEDDEVAEHSRCSFFFTAAFDVRLAHLDMHLSSDNGRPKEDTRRRLSLIARRYFII